MAMTKPINEQKKEHQQNRRRRIELVKNPHHREIVIILNVKYLGIITFWSMIWCCICNSRQIHVFVFGAKELVINSRCVSPVFSIPNVYTL